MEAAIERRVCEVKLTIPYLINRVNIKLILKINHVTLIKLKIRILCHVMCRTHFVNASHRVFELSDYCHICDIKSQFNKVTLAFF